MAEGISQSKQISSCGYYHKQERAVPMSRASPREVCLMNSCYSNREIEELAEGMVRQYLGKR